jgi:hypothetical protein
MKTTLKQFIVKCIPPKWLGTLELYLRPHLKDSLGGPFNGQQFRQTIFLELISTFKFEAIIETGTYRGNTTEFLSKKSQLPVYTVEQNRRLYYYSKRRLRHLKNVNVELGDSIAFLERIAQDYTVPKHDIFFYLDAHWDKNLPLFEEIDLICKYWNMSVVMIDDFQVPGDEGYIYDDYGSGKRLSLEYLYPLSKVQMTAFFPSKPSQYETGARCGCVVLAQYNAAAKKMSLVNSLRPHDNEDS